MKESIERCSKSILKKLVERCEMFKEHIHREFVQSMYIFFNRSHFSKLVTKTLSNMNSAAVQRDEGTNLKLSAKFWKKRKGRHTISL